MKTCQHDTTQEHQRDNASHAGVAAWQHMLEAGRLVMTVFFDNASNHSLIKWKPVPEPPAREPPPQPAPEFAPEFAPEPLPGPVPGQLLLRNLLRNRCPSLLRNLLRSL